MKRFISIGILIFATTAVFAVDRISILFLVSYDSSFPTYHMQYEGLKKGFGDSLLDMDLHIEFLDSKTYPYGEIKENKRASLAYKIQKTRPFDYVITADDNALIFVLEYKEQLFRDTPIVFFGVNNQDLALSQNKNPMVTGFIEDISYNETLDAIHQILPEMKELNILYDNTPSGLGDYERIKKMNEVRQDTVFNYLSLGTYTFDELYRHLASLTVDQPVLLLSAFRDKNEESLEFYESVHNLSSNSGAPVFHLWGHGIGQGLIGGKVVDHSYYAELSAQLILRIIAGEGIDKIKVTVSQNNRFLFDADVLKKFNLRKNALPRGSIILNDHSLLTGKALSIILTLLIIIVFLLAVLLIFYRQYKIRLAAEKQIRSLNEELMKEKESLAITLKCIGDGVIVIDNRGRITLMNDVSALLTGWPAPEAIGRDLKEIVHIVHEFTSLPLENPALIALESGLISSVNTHTALVSRSGSRYIIEDSASPMVDEEGRITGAILVLRDVTEKMQYMESANRNQKLEALGVLAGGIAHDFNNYLGGVLGFVELAKLEIENQSTGIASNYLQKILDVSEKAKSLTNQLLTFSKGGTPKREIINLARTIEKSVHFALSGSTITPRLNLDKNLWNSYCDVSQISQCIDNLVINALQAMPEGGDLTVSARNTGENPPDLARGNYIRIDVSDTGSGIPPENMDKIFYPFYTTKEEGHGLGLATVHSIVKNHDGSIQVKTELNKGTQFSIFLPGYPDTGEPMFMKNENIYTGAGLVLVLDDQKYILDMMKAMLTNLGYTILPVMTSAQALVELAKDRENPGSSKIRACILDLTLPGDRQGYQTAEEIEKMAPDLPVIATSGYSDSPVMAYPRKYHFSDSLFKPFTIQELSDILKKWIP